MSRLQNKQKNAGFTILETMVAMAVLLGVGSIVMYGTVRMMNTSGTIANRTEMHTSVRSATELMQQEIGQAGRIAGLLIRILRSRIARVPAQRRSSRE